MNAARLSRTQRDWYASAALDRSYLDRFLSGAVRLPGRRRADPIVLLEQLAAATADGTPTVAAAQQVAAQASTPAERVLLEDVASQLAGGARLPDALAAHSAVFPPYTIAVVEAYLSVHTTPAALAAVVARLRTQAQMQAQHLRGTLTYALLALILLALAGTTTAVLRPTQMPGVSIVVQVLGLLAGLTLAAAVPLRRVVSARVGRHIGRAALAEAVRGDLCAAGLPEAKADQLAGPLAEPGDARVPGTAVRALAVAVPAAAWIGTWILCWVSPR